MDIQRLRLIIDSAPAAEGAAAWGKYTRQVGQDAVSATGQIVKMESAIDSFSRTIRATAGAVGLALGVEKVIEYADTWKLVEGRLRIVTDTTKQMHGVQGQLFDIAQKTRTSYEDIANTYARVARSTRDLKVSQTELLSITETLSKAITISGVTTQQARMGMIQLGQAFAIGRLQGQDMRMLFEDIPRIGLAISEGLNVPIGKLKEMGSQGKLTSEMVIQGLANARESIDREFGQMPRTVGQSIQQLTNAVQKFIGEQDHGLGITSALSGAIGLLAKNFNTLANAALLFGAAKLSGVISGLIAPTIQEATAIATGNAVLLDSRTAYVQRAEAAQQSSRAMIAASADAVASIRAEITATQQLQMAQRSQLATAKERLAMPVAGAGLPAQYGIPSRMADQDFSQRLQAERDLAVSGGKLEQLSLRMQALRTAETAATNAGTEAVRMNTAANIQRAVALETSTAAIVAETIAARAAAAATSLFNGALALVGGPIGAAVLGLILFVGWLFKKQQAEADAIEETTRHTAAIRTQSAELAKLHRDMVEDLTDIVQQQVALDRGGQKDLDRAKEQIKARDLARKYWKSYQEALKDDTGGEAAVARELTLEQALKSNIASVRQAATERNQYAGLVVSANAKLTASEEAAKKAAEKRKEASDALTRKLKEEAEARQKVVADIAAETDAVQLNADAAGQAKSVREAWALQAKISIEIHKQHADALATDSEEVLLQKAALRDLIATQMVENDALTRMTAAKNALRDASDDIAIELDNANQLSDAYKKGADAVERLKLEQAADAQIRRLTNGLTREQIAAIQDKLTAYRAELIALGQLNAANTASATAGKQEIAAARRDAADAARETEQLMKNALRGAQAAAASFFESLVTGGVNSFQRIVDAAQTMFVKFFAQLAAQRLGESVIGSLTQAPRLLRGGTMSTGPGVGAQALGYLGIGLAGFSTGYGIGQSTNSTGLAALGGAASGAAAGAMIGSVVPVIGTAVGAVVGGVAGLVGGLLGNSAKIKKEREELEKNRKEFFDELDKFVYGLGEHSDLAKSLHDLAENLDAVEKKAAELKLGAKALAEAEAAAADASARAKAAFMASIDAQINDANGKGYINQVVGFQKAYAQNLKDIALAGGDVSKAAVLFVAQLDKMGDSMSTGDLRDLIAQLPGLTKGLDPELVQQLADALGNDLAKAIGDLDTEARATAENITRGNEDLRVRFARATGNPRADDLARSYAQRQALVDATNGGASPEYLAQLKMVQLFETAQALVQEQTTAQVKAIQDQTSAEEKHLDELTKAAQTQLSVQEDALSVAQQNLSATQRVVDSLSAYGKSLVVGQYSPLSGIDQSVAARQQVDDAFTRAMAGDRDAAGEFQQLSTAFLDVLRSTYGSSTTYANGFADVQSMLEKLSDKFGDQASNEQLTLTAAQQQVDLLTQQLDSLAALKDSTQAAADAQISALQDVSNQQALVRQAVVAALVDQRDTATAAADAQIDELHALQNINAARLDTISAQLETTSLRYIQQLTDGDTQAAQATFQVLSAQVAVRDELVLARDQMAAQLTALEESKAAAIESANAQVAAVEALGIAQAAAQAATTVDAATVITQGIDAAAEYQHLAILAVKATLDAERLEYNTHAIEQINEIRRGGDIADAMLTKMEADRVDHNQQLKEQTDRIVTALAGLPYELPATDGNGTPITRRGGNGPLVLPTLGISGAQLADLVSDLVDATGETNVILTTLAKITSSSSSQTVDSLKAVSDRLDSVNDQLRLSIAGV